MYSESLTSILRLRLRTIALNIDHDHQIYHNYCFSFNGRFYILVFLKCRGAKVTNEPIVDILRFKPPF